MENRKMNSIEITSPQNSIIGSADEVLQIPQNIGINFDSIQKMVDDIEQKLISEDKAEKATKKL